MRALLSPALSTVASAVLALGATLGGCNRACPSASAALPADHTPMGDAIDVRFAVTARAGDVAQVLLLRTTGSTVAPVRDFASASGAVAADTWLDRRSRWPNMLGQGIGATPVLPPGPPNGPFVTVGGATSVVQFTLAAPSTADAGVPSFDAGLAPERSRQWEWVLPALTVPDGVAPPRVADVVVVPRYLPDHDVAVVSRTAVSVAGTLIGGELFLLDIDDATRVIPLATLSLDAFADPSLHAVAAGMVYGPDGLVYAALDHQTFEAVLPGAGPGLIAVVDPAMRSVRTVLRVPTLTGCTEIAPYHPPARVAGDPADPGETFRLVVTCHGSVATAGSPPTDGGFVYVEHDPASAGSMPVIAQTISAASLSLPRADGGATPLFGHWIAYVSRGDAATSAPDRLIAANLASGDHPILATAIADDGASHVGLGVSAFDPASGILVVPNGLDGVDTWELPADYRTIESGSYAFPDRTEVAVVSCGHLATRTARVIGAGAGGAPAVDAAVPDVDAATPEVDAASPDLDAAVPEVDAASPEVDAATPDAG